MSLTNASPEAAAAAARTASLTLATLPGRDRDAALDAVHDALSASRSEILAANARDLTAAGAGPLPDSLVARLDLSRKGKFDDMLRGIRDVRKLSDPVGQITLRTALDDSLELHRVSCPIGVLLVIFEARPEVIANIASLAIKSGNAAILKGGKESTESFIAIAQTISRALDSTAVPNDAIQLVTTRDVIPQLLALDRDIDLVIPRGGPALVRHVKSLSRIPVLGHADGLCTIYLAADADPDAAVRVLVDAKTSYPAACNAVETLLVHRAALAGPAFSAVVRALKQRGVTLRCDGESARAAAEALGRSNNNSSSSDNGIYPASDADFDTEFLALILAVKTVGGLDEAVAHINAHGSHHTDAILTACEADAEAFMASVDSAGVFWNASTRFADGNRFGFGTEVGISTNKIHSRGPVGLDGLMIYKYKLRGRGQAASEYGDGPGLRPFKHTSLPPI